MIKHNSFFQHIITVIVAVFFVFFFASTLTGKLPRSYWKGSLPIDYGIQTDDTDTRRVTLTVNNQLIRRDIHNVIGYIRGHQEPGNDDDGSDGIVMMMMMMNVVAS